MKKLLLLTLAIVTLTSLFYCQNSPAPIKRGGIIVYETDGHGLVAAPKDLGVMDWGSAKTACDTLTLNGYSDWRLPSEEELNQLNLNNVIDISFSVNYNYWSSTELGKGKGFAVSRSFTFRSHQYPCIKLGKCGVRAVRSF